MAYDVIVIGAGFAGATVARECATRGLRTLILEGRDRVGGRTWTSRLSDGEVAEIGGTYVHWSQPHTWSEITRYGLEDEVVDAVADFPEWALVPKDDGLEWCTMEAHVEREKGLLERVFEQSSTALPRPHDPLHVRTAVAELDKLSVRDRLNQLDLSPEDDAFLTSLFSTECANTDTEGSFLSLMRWWAAAGHTYERMQEAVFGYKLKNGIAGLVESILADGGSTLRLNSPVTRIVSDDDTVEVAIRSGERYSASVVVVATPSGVWPYLEVSPPLSEERLEAAREGIQAPRAAKVIVVLRGEERRFYIQPRAGHPVGLMWTSHQRSADEQVAVLFSSPAMGNASDATVIRAAIADLLPQAEVIEVLSGTYHDDDEFARGAWPFPGRGHLTRFAPHERLARPEGRLVFATADIARLWNSFFDGAIESGLRAAREVRQILGVGTETPQNQVASSGSSVQT